MLVVILVIVYEERPLPFSLSGADIQMLKRHGGWHSTSVAEGYIEESIENKVKMSKMIFSDTQPRPSVISPAQQTVATNETSFVFTEVRPKTPVIIVESGVITFSNLSKLCI